MTMTVWEEGHYDYTISFALLFTCQLRFSRKSVSLQIFQPPDAVPQQVVKAFQNIASEVDSETHHYKSDEVLAVVRPGLETTNFTVEKSKRGEDLVAVPVLYGVNGRTEKSFEADGYLQSAGYVVEVEAGRGVVNYQFLKDFFEACTMVGVETRCIAVRNTYNRMTLRRFADSLKPCMRVDGWEYRSQDC